MKKTLVMLLALTAMVACNNGGNKVPAIDTANFDTEVSPGADFYAYANGGWQKRNPLKPEYSRFGRFDELQEQNVERINELFQNILEQPQDSGTVNRKIADIYRLGLDSTRLNEDGAAPLKPYLDEIRAASDWKSLAGVLAHVHRNGSGPFWSFRVGPDDQDSNTNVAGLSQPRLGLGNRDYYIDPKNAELKEGYRQFLTKVLTLAGVESPEKAADDALEVEDALAKASWSRVEASDSWKTYNPTSYKKILKDYPNLRFDAYTAEGGVAPELLEKVIVAEPSYFQALNAYVRRTPVSKLKNYVTACVVKDACDYLSDDFYAASFDFFSRQMAGIRDQKPRWKRAQTTTDRLLGQAVGQLYVAKYFPEADKERMLSLVENIRTAFHQHIDSLDWMGPETKAKAHEKLAAITPKIGYPDKWKDYGDLVIDPSLPYYENIVRANNWRSADNLSKLGQPVDKTEWHMPPQTVNAYYSESSNEICFPAAILQPPFYNTDADDAVNYGAIGVVIGHEISHGFDNHGRNYDKDGNLNDWWTPEDAAAFQAKADRLTAQFNETEVLPGVYADGEMTLGENIADLGGLSIARTALYNALGDNVPGPIDGFTPDQRFYLGYAAVWAQNITDEEVARRTKLDEHAVGRNRVNVTIRNFGPFFDAFGIQPGDPMYRPEDERVVIW